MNIIPLVKKKKRVGRGIGSRGAKSGKGQKGQRSRAGFTHKAGFEGGQTRLYFRLPKGRGTKQIFASQVRKPVELTIKQLNGFSDDIIGPGVLRKAGFLKSKVETVKLIGSGEVKKKYTVRAHKASAGAIRAVEAAGGKVELIES